MGIQKTIKRQYQDIVDRAASQLTNVQHPNEGWVVTVRKALGMSGAQLARRLGVSRASVSQTEKNEMSGRLTLKHMQKTAEAMDCQFVYAIVPKDSIENVIENKAEQNARELVRRASGHMALEQQSLPLEKNKQEIARLRDEMIHDMPSDFWEEP